MKQTEALKLALEALKELRMLGMNAQWHDSWLAKPNEAIAAIREALAEQPAPPPECKTDAEKTAFAFGWWKALEENRKQPAQPSKPWVGLVWGELPEDGHNHDFLRGAVWAEAKLKDKNGY